METWQIVVIVIVLGMVMTVMAASAIIVSDKISDLENDVNNVQRDNEANNANLVSLVQGNASQIQENDAELARNENNYGTIWSSRYPINYGWGGIRSHRSPITLAIAHLVITHLTLTLLRKIK